MKINIHHQTILEEILKQSGSATSQTFRDEYLGNSHPRYPINAPKLRAIAKAWARTNRDLTAVEFFDVLDSLIKAPSSTEKVMAGMIMDSATGDQIKFNPKCFDEWLNHLEGWAEVDAVCTGNFTIRAIPYGWPTWKKLINRFAKSKNINKRRAALVLLCSPIRYTNDADMRNSAFATIELLSHEKEILITKAISWLLRSMIKHHKPAVKKFLAIHADTLPSIAVRETNVMLKTGTKTKQKTKRSE
jgi:3-methyladenine DNA glycosylase AlkD